MLVDTNVLIGVLEKDPDWIDRSVAQLHAQSKVHRLVINPIIYRGLSLTFSSVEAMDHMLEGLELRIFERPESVLSSAAKPS